jgi:uncharacterized protein YndB with AHSA1/START domain
MNHPPRIDQASRHINARPEKVYRAFMDPGSLMVWLPPSGMKAYLDYFEPRVGGRYRMTLTYETADHTPGKSSTHSDVTEGRYVELVPNERVVHLVDFKSDDPRFAGTMKMTWSIRPSGSGSEVTFAAEQVPEGISQSDHLQGLNDSLRNLAGLLER